MLWHHLCFLRFERYRVNCPRCGIRTEALRFVDVRGPRVTLRLAHLAAELSKVMTNKSVGLFQVLHRGTVKEIDKRSMAKIQAERPLDGITVMGADEIAVGKGQRYWTMLSAVEGPRGPELLNVVGGRREKSLRKFWNQKGQIISSAQDREKKSRTPSKSAIRGASTSSLNRCNPFGKLCKTVRRHPSGRDVQRV